jgi:hypothetical protein
MAVAFPRAFIGAFIGAFNGAFNGAFTGALTVTYSCFYKRAKTTKAYESLWKLAPFLIHPRSWLSVLRGILLLPPSGCNHRFVNIHNAAKTGPCLEFSAEIPDRSTAIQRQPADNGQAHKYRTWTCPGIFEKIV